MHNLLKKSQRNYDSAIILNKEEKYCTVPHCAYYSCYQLMIFIWGNDGTNYFGENSHNKFINEFAKEIQRKSHKKSQIFSNEMRKLKIKRAQADYSKNEIQEGESSFCIKTANKILNILDTTFKNIIDESK
ncbi:MAG: hypothetical protein LBV43_09905 [Prevotella sp.]|jgi:uncharacterized protein (UPF0332 family)|nr:hypothetical protein [Prevotella sp.]